MSKIVLLYPSFFSIECFTLRNYLKTSGIVGKKKKSMDRFSHLIIVPYESPAARMTYNASTDCVEFGVFATLN